MSFPIALKVKDASLQAMVAGSSRAHMLEADMVERRTCASRYKKWPPSILLRGLRESMLVGRVHVAPLRL